MLTVNNNINYNLKNLQYLFINYTYVFTHIITCVGKCVSEKYQKIVLYQLIIVVEFNRQDVKNYNEYYWKVTKII